VEALTSEVTTLVTETTTTTITTLGIDVDTANHFFELGVSAIQFGLLVFVVVIVYKLFKLFF